MADITDRMFRTEPSSFGGEAVEAILGDDLKRVLGKSAPRVDRPHSFFEVDDLRCLIKKNAPHRLATLDGWVARRKARIDKHNAGINKLIADRARVYMDEMGKDKSWAFWNAKFDVYRQLEPELDCEE